MRHIDRDGFRLYAFTYDQLAEVVTQRQTDLNAKYGTEQVVDAMMDDETELAELMRILLLEDPTINPHSLIGVAFDGMMDDDPGNPHSFGEHSWTVFSIADLKDYTWLTTEEEPVGAQ